MAAIDQVQLLVDRFESLGRSAHSYSEARTVNEFIIPLFDTLGWDVRNARTAGEVVPEEQVSRGRVDWAFRLRGVPRFYLEAKRPAADLDDPESARQAINYAYNKGFTWAVLTNFERLRVYDAEWDAPNPNLNLFFELRFDQFASDPRLQWLSRDAFAAGVLNDEGRGEGADASECAGREVTRRCSARVGGSSRCWRSAAWGSPVNGRSTGPSN